MSASPASPAPQIKRRGLMLVLSSPSGAGKTSIARRLLQLEPNLSLSISVTTRPRRPSEVDRRDYHFIDQAVYDAMIAAGELLEHAEVYGHGYGTPRSPVEDALAAGRDVLFDIDWQGTQQLREAAQRHGQRIHPAAVDGRAGATTGAARRGYARRRCANGLPTSRPT